jgi:uncharacterized protein
MQFTQLTATDRNLITAYGDDHVTVNGIRYSESLIVRPDALEARWDVSCVVDLNLDHLAQLISDPPEILLLGTGLQQRFPEKLLWRSLKQTFRALEVMHNAAACRTYNLIASEGRDVAVALIFEAGDLHRVKA